MKTSTDAFQQKLDHYGLAAQSHLQGDKSAVEWGAYAAAAGASLAMAGAADAAVIYSGVQNVSVAIDPAATAAGNTFASNNYASIDIDNDTTPDVGLRALLYAGVDSTDPGNSFKYIGYAFAGPAGGAAMLVSGGLAKKLASGSLIGPSGSFGSAGNGRFFVRGNTNGAPGGTSTYVLGNFADGEIAFLGLQLGSGNFGWIRLRMDDLGANQPLANFAPPDTPVQDGSGFLDRVTVIDWAFDDSGAAIRAGQIQAVPEPSPLALLAAGAVGLGALRRRAQRATANAS